MSCPTSSAPRLAACYSGLPSAGSSKPRHSRSVWRRGAGSLCLLFACGACDSEPKEPPRTTSAPLAESARATATPPKPSPPPSSTRPSVRRPKDLSELVLNPRRRQTLEQRFSQARGFLEQSEVERQLFAKPLKRGNDAEAQKALDSVAQNRWMLFSGNILEPADAGFKLAVRYTPREAQDPLGLTSAWLPVHFTNVEGFDAKNYRPGEAIAVLAKYVGKGRVEGARDVVFLQAWEFDD